MCGGGRLGKGGLQHTHIQDWGGMGEGVYAILRCADIIPACCIVRYTVSDKLTPDCQLINKLGLRIS